MVYEAYNGCFQIIGSGTWHKERQLGNTYEIDIVLGLFR